MGTLKLNKKENGQETQATEIIEETASAVPATLSTENTSYVTSKMVLAGEEYLSYVNVHYTDSTSEPDETEGVLLVHEINGDTGYDFTTITVHRSNISVADEVKKAELCIVARDGERKNASGYFKLQVIRNLADKIDNTSYALGHNKKYNIDITELFKACTNDFEIDLFGIASESVNESYAEFYNFGENAPKIVITYNGEREEYDWNQSPEIKQFGMGEKANIYFNLNNSDTVTEVCDLVVGRKMPIKISHIHKLNGQNVGLGSNWRLNLDNKYLKSAFDDTGSDTKFRYVDELGGEHSFKEEYYFFNADKQRIFIDKDLVELTANGELTYEGYKVYTHQSCGGQTLIPRVEDYVNSEFFEQRQNEQIQLENTVKQYEQSLSNLVIFNAGENGGKGSIIRKIGGLKKSDLEIFMSKANENTDYLVASESEALQLQSILISIKQADEQLDMYKEQLEYFEELLKAYESYDNAYVEYRKDSLEHDKVKLDKNNLIKQLDMLDTQLKSIETQKDFYIHLFRENKKVLPETFTDYLKKKRELETYLAQVPVNYLRDKNGIISGYNSDGRLVCVFDAYENFASIEYNSDGKISGIYEGDIKVADFEYLDGTLYSITDNRGRKVTYEYNSDASKLTAIVYPNGEKYEIKYSNNRMGDITSSEGMQWKMSYTDGKLSSLMTKRTKPETGTVSEVKISCTSNFIEITYSDGASERYELDDLSRVVAYRKLNGSLYGKKTDISYEYNNGKIITYSSRNSTEYVDENVIEQYDELDLLVKKTVDWMPVSDTVKVKTVTDYSYDLNENLISAVSTKYIDSSDTVSEITSVTNYSYNAQNRPVLTESYIVGEELSSGKNYKQTVYDKNGHVVKTISWNSLDSSSKFYEESDCDESGRVIADRDETGEISAEYGYVAESNTVGTVTYANGSQFAYGREPHDDKITSITQSTESGEENTTDIIYEYGLPKKVKSGNTEIEYFYDSKGRKNYVKVNGEIQAVYSYEDYKEVSPDEVRHYKNSQVLKVDGKDVKSVYCKEGFMDDDEHVMEDSETLTIGKDRQYFKQYRANGDLFYVTYKDGTEKTVYYTYDEYHNLLQAQTVTDEDVEISNETYEYNGYGELTKKSYSGAVTQTYSYTYTPNAARNLEYIQFGTYTFKPLTDVNGRNIGREIYNGTEKIAAERITYRKVGDHATNMPACVWFGKGKNITESIKYKYDRLGNICEITENGHVVVKYTYDGLNRLVREDNKLSGSTVLYSYDQSGNITERCEYEYTSKSGEELSELECTHHTYDYDGDKLKSYDGKSFLYNSIGNPTVYRDRAVEWEYGTRLVRMGGTTFAYDGLGRRVRKNGITFTYDNEGRLIAQDNGLEFIYDTTGVAGVKYNGVLYAYRKDVQGNIIAILDSSGAVVVKYIYDAWGNNAVVNASGKIVTSGIGVLNPFRYRGYYYDTETELYYLQTRYYDPELGRFISQDSLDYADPETINGLNLYAYCGNNPVMNVDPTGCSWNSFWNNVGNWFINVGNSIKNFFVDTVWNGGLVPAWNSVSNFFTNTIPDFFENTVWYGGLVPAWNAVSNFFTNTIPDFFVNTVWYGGLVPAWNTVSDFFVNTFWNDWIVDKVWNTFCVDWVWNTFCVKWVWQDFCVDYIWNDLWKNLSEDKIFLGIVSLASIGSYFAHPLIGLGVSIFSGLLWFRTLFD